MGNQRKVLWGLMALIAVLLLLGSLIGGGALLALQLSASPTDEISIALFGGAAALVAILAGALLATSARAFGGQPSPTSYARHTWLIWLLLWGGFLAAAWFLPPVVNLPWLFALIHLALIVLPALLLLSVAIRAAGPEAAPSRRWLLVGVVAGIIAVIPSIIGEGIGLLLGSVFVIFVAYLIPGGEAEVERLLAYFEQLATVDPSTVDMDQLAGMLSSPIVIAILLLTLALVAPIVEEIFKSVFIAAASFRHRFTLREAFIWGTTAGFGFAILEGIFNGGMSLGDQAGWMSGVLVRVPATALHALVTGIIGVGWAIFQRNRKRWWAVPLTYAAAIVYHGVWNFSSVVLVGSTGLLTMDETWVGQGLGGIGLVGAGALLIGLMLSALAGIGLVPHLLRRRARRRAA